MTDQGMTTSETLNRAADLIEERGWTGDGTGWRGDGALCLEGGIAAAMGIDFTAAWNCPAYRAVRDYLMGESPFLWNDRLRHLRVSAAIDAHDYSSGVAFDMAAARAEANEWAAAEVIATFRAAAVIEAANEATADPLVAHLVHHAVDIIAAELDQTAVTG